MRNELKTIGLSFAVLISIAVAICLIIAVISNVVSGDNSWWAAKSDAEQIKILLYICVFLLLAKN